MRDMKTNISVKILYFFRRSWLIQTLRGRSREEFLPEYFIPGVLLKRSDLCFDLLALFEYLLRIKVKKKKMRK